LQNQKKAKKKAEKKNYERMEFKHDWKRPVSPTYECSCKPTLLRKAGRGNARKCVVVEEQSRRRQQKRWTS